MVIKDGMNINFKGQHLLQLLVNLQNIDQANKEALLKLYLHLSEKSQVLIDQSLIDNILNDSKYDHRLISILKDYTSKSCSN